MLLAYSCRVFSSAQNMNTHTLHNHKHTHIHHKHTHTHTHAHTMEMFFTITEYHVSLRTVARGIPQGLKKTMRGESQTRVCFYCFSVTHTLPKKKHRHSHRDTQTNIQQNSRKKTHAIFIFNKK